MAASLGLAQAALRSGDAQGATGHYNTALSEDLLGLGFALLNSGDEGARGAAFEAMRRSQELAVRQGQARQADFVTSIIAQVERPIADTLTSVVDRTFSMTDTLKADTCGAPEEPEALERLVSDPLALLGERHEVLERGDWVIATPCPFPAPRHSPGLAAHLHQQLQPDDGSGCVACQKLFGVLEDFIPERGRWAVRLTNGRTCAARDEQLTKAPFQPFQRVEIVGDDCGPLAGLCGQVVAFLPFRHCWSIELDVGHITIAGSDELVATERLPLKPSLRQLQVLAWAKSSVSRASSAHLLPLDLTETIAGLLPRNPPITLWARFLAVEYRRSHY